MLTVFPYGLAVRIPGFHPGGPGSTPGMGNAKHFNDPHTPSAETSKAVFSIVSSNHSLVVKVARVKARNADKTGQGISRVSNKKSNNIRNTGTHRGS